MSKIIKHNKQKAKLTDMIICSSIYLMMKIPFNLKGGMNDGQAIGIQM